MLDSLLGNGQLYDVAETIRNIDLSKSNMLLFGSIANILAYVQIIYGVRMGFKHKSHAIPMFANMMFFAHDSWYVLNVDYWFNTVDHVFFKGNMIAMSVFCVLELVIAWQIITYSRDEVRLGKTRAQALFNYVAIQAGVYVMFLWFRSMLVDPLYVECFAISIVFSNLFNIPLLLGRGSRKGQSLVIAWALAIQTGPVGFFLVHPNMGPYFMQPAWILAGIANTILAWVYLWMLYKAKPYRLPASEEQGQMRPALAAGQ